MNQGLGVLGAILAGLGGTLIKTGADLMRDSDQRAEWKAGLAVLFCGILAFVAGMLLVIWMIRRASAAEREAEAARQREPSLVLRNLVEELDHVCTLAPSLDPYEPQNMGSIHRAKVQEAVNRTESQIPTITDDKKRQAVRDIARRVEAVVKGGDKNRYAALDTVRQQARRLLADWDER